MRHIRFALQNLHVGVFPVQNPQHPVIDHRRLFIQQLFPFLLLPQVFIDPLRRWFDHLVRRSLGPCHPLLISLMDRLVQLELGAKFSLIFHDEVILLDHGAFSGFDLLFRLLLGLSDLLIIRILFNQVDLALFLSFAGFGRCLCIISNVLFGLKHHLVQFLGHLFLEALLANHWPFAFLNFIIANDLFNDFCRCFAISNSNNLYGLTLILHISLDHLFLQVFNLFFF